LLGDVLDQSPRVVILRVAADGAQRDGGGRDLALIHLRDATLLDHLGGHVGRIDDRGGHDRLGVVDPCREREHRRELTVPTVVSSRLPVGS
jgi:hypothetical protein